MAKTSILGISDSQLGNIILGGVPTTAPPPADLPPVASLVLSTPGGGSLQVNADASGSTDTDITPISTYKFVFSDGTTVGPQAGATASHTFGAYGTVSVTLTVTDTASQSSVLTKTITLSSTGTSPPPPPWPYKILLKTGTGLDLNDGVNYQVEAIDIGDPQRTEVWGETWSSKNASGNRVSSTVFITPVGLPPVEGAIQITITLKVMGTTPGAIITQAKAVQNKFLYGTETSRSGEPITTLQYSIDDPVNSTFKVFEIYPSAIDPIIHNERDIMMVMTQGWISWTFKVWRKPLNLGATAVPIG